MNKYLAECIGYSPIYKDIDFIQLYVNADSLEEAEDKAKEKIRYNTSPINVKLVEKNIEKS